MSSKQAEGSARGFGRPRECATTARQKGLPSDAKRASEEEEDDEDDGDDGEGVEEEEEVEAEEREGQGAL